MANYKHMYKINIDSIEHIVAESIMDSPESAVQIYHDAYFFGLPLSVERIEDLWHYCAIRRLTNIPTSQRDAALTKLAGKIDAFTEAINGTESDDE